MKTKKSPEQIKFEAVNNEAFDALLENRFDEWTEAHKEEFEEAQVYAHYLMAKETERRWTILLRAVGVSVAIAIVTVLILLTKRLLLPI